MSALPTRRAVLATSNAGKLREMREILASIDITVFPQSEFGVSGADETGVTFVENALIKARHASRLAGLPAIADDSGLEVDALNGAPGVWSARYAGSGATDKANLEKLLLNLKDTPETQRRARFHCLMAYLKRPEDPTPIVCHGVWEGSVLFEPRGENGFGYDPIFFVATHRCSSAELPADVKNALSHRGQALRQLLQQLQAIS
jgi:XTP/dITP diphosphohydrolase